MTIKDKKKYEEVDARLEQLLEKGTELGGMDLLSEEEQEGWTDNRFCFCPIFMRRSRGLDSGSA